MGPGANVVARELGAGGVGEHGGQRHVEVVLACANANGTQQSLAASPLQRGSATQPGEFDSDRTGGWRRVARKAEGGGGDVAQGGAGTVDEEGGHPEGQQRVRRGQAVGLGGGVRPAAEEDLAMAPAA
jgi:hypothetical protein